MAFIKLFLLLTSKVVNTGLVHLFNKMKKLCTIKVLKHRVSNLELENVVDLVFKNEVLQTYLDESGFFRC